MNGAARYVTDLVEACERYAERPALSSGPWVLTHSEVLSWTYRLAGALAGLGIGRGSGLACVSAGNSPRTLLVRLAAHILGARLTQVCVGPTTHALDHLLRDCAPSLVVHDTPVPPGPGARIGLAALLELAAAREALPVPVAARDGDVARVTYTGGTTGLPKGVVSTFAAMAARTATRTDSPGADGPGPLVFVSVDALSQRSGGRCLEQLRIGGRSEILHPFDTRAFAEACRRLGPASTYLTPSMLYRLLDDPETADGVPGLVRVSYGDSPVHPERLRRAVTRWGPGVRWTQGYGMNEAGVLSRLSPADHDAAVTDRPHLLGSVGRPVAGVEVEVRGAAPGAPGEVWVRSPMVMAGYRDRPALTAEALREGWLRTGDVGHFDGEGYLYLDDRVKDVVMVHGANVYCGPIETELTRHPAVARAAVVGRTDAVTGEAVCAFLVAAPGRAPTDEVAAEACDLVGAALAPGHRPTAVFWLAALPLTEGGKPDKRRLRELAATAGARGPAGAPGSAEDGGRGLG
ncbi:class I adenylate-forming enzyme family protein [Streptomyces sp. NBC_00096]|uniref:class I adenylate-forming enzyme family protein n=1 Tax=Streptomyces sp. NBC_00096 TaxID=2975650 RepID=UPI0032512725